MTRRIIRQSDSIYTLHEAVDPWARARARQKWLDPRHHNDPLPKAEYARDDEDDPLLIQAFDLHKFTDPINRGLDRMEEAEIGHLQAPFKAITNYDDYVDPQEHQWNPAQANDPDDSSSYNDQMNAWNEFGVDHEERARAKRKKELADVGRDSVEGLSNIALGITGAQKTSATYPTPSTGMSRYLLLPHWDPEECVGLMHDHALDMAHHTASVPVPAPTNLEEAIGQVGKDTEKFKVSREHYALPQVTPQLMQQAHQGGFTLHDHVGDGPTSGYMVSLDKNTEQPLPISQLTPKMVSDYVNKHANQLQDPNSYLGGWLNNGTFYLDISHHLPDLYHATKSALGAHQLGIYDLNHGRTIDTDEAGWMTGNPQVVGSNGGRRRQESASAVRAAQGQPRAGRQQAARSRRPASMVRRAAITPDELDRLPEHDWTQHRLGTDEDWGLTPRTGAAPVIPATPQAPAPAPPEPTPAPPPAEPPPWDSLTNTGKQIGTHGGQVFSQGPNGENWLVKPTPPGKGFLADADVAANHIAQLSGIATPPTFKSLHPDTGQPASMQLMYPAKDAFPNHKVPPQLAPDDLLELQKHHALDWLLGNHDSHPGQYIRNQDGHLIGIDKAQSFKYANQDKLNWKTHMNQHEPIHNTLWRNFATGGQELADPRQPGPLHDYVHGLQSIPDEEIAKTLTPYAEGAKKAGELGKQFSHQHLSPSVKFQPNHTGAFINHVVKRKNSLMDDLGNLWDRAYAHRMTGTKIAANTRSLPSAQFGPRGLDQNRLSSAKTASVYTVNLKLNDKSVDESIPVDEWPQAVAKQKAHDLAGKHGLTLKEMGRSPDDMGRLPLYMPAYRGNDYVGNATIDRTENMHQENNPYGPHADQYAYAKKLAAPGLPNVGIHPIQAPTMPSLPKLPTPVTPPTPAGGPKLPSGGSQEPAGPIDTVAPKDTTPHVVQSPSQHSWQWKAENNGVSDNFQNDLQESENIHHIDPSTGHPGTGGGGGGGASMPSVPGSAGAGGAAGGAAGVSLPAGGGVPLTQKPDGSWTSSDPAWAHLINRESGGHNIIQAPSTHDVNSGGNEAFGLFQITPGTWSAHGGQGSVYNSTPQQQAQVAAEILRRNPSGSDWGAGLAGREDAAALGRGLAGPAPGAQQ